MTAQQFQKLGKTGKPRAKKPARTAGLREKDVIRAIADFLALHGWRTEKLHAGTMSVKGCYIRLGKRGRPDKLSVHPTFPAFYWEAKRPGEIPKPEQLDALAALMSVGFRAVWFDSFETFKEWYTRIFLTGIVLNAGNNSSR